ncbi:GmrSD restriction endonuclease domain-containing protein [Methylotenera versatilis]|uniref:GmrSD restriction endonucleases N-terminal domain-containing protein n=1 Tax=Methylotenera versatilis (strain 301) TaxID=666681 RepID=D7DJD3_METV0|nr:DUF262 domain-containing protein [Methylotenera versatilis]ADI30168.1 Protein of unknown function DUF2081 [Methylotenera versatilis 301]
MSTQRYTVTPHPVETLLTWVKSGEIAIPEIQRPFVWEATKVRNLLDSLYQGYPIGYLIAWKNPNVKLKDGSTSSGKRILIDGQQRVTALMAALLGIEVLTDDYENKQIQIAFNPQTEAFEVTNPAIRKNPVWIPDVASVFNPQSSVFTLVTEYCKENPECTQDHIFKVIEKLRGITNNHVGIIDLAEDLDIETVTEIFIRVNSAGSPLSQADFAMSKIAVNSTYGGNMLRKAIDYFCHLSIAPEFLAKIKKGDSAFVASEFFEKIKWVSDVNDDIYDPAYTDMLRVAFTSEFGRGKLQDLVALLSGRNFETKQYEEVIAEESFAKLKQGILAFVNKTHFDRITMILRSAGFVISGLIGSQNAINFAYIIYLRGRRESVPAADLERLVRRWFVMSMLRGRYSGSPESTFDFDIRQIDSRGVVDYVESVIPNELPDSFWTGMLPQFMDTSSIGSPYFRCYQAAQIKLGDKGFLSRDITVTDLLLNRADVHHIYPKKYLQDDGKTRAVYNQIANFVIAQSEINIAVGAKAPEVYFTELVNQVSTGVKKYGGITEHAELLANLRMNCIPEIMLNGNAIDYADFLAERRKLMSLKIKEWFELL